MGSDVQTHQEPNPRSNISILSDIFFLCLQRILGATHSILSLALGLIHFAFGVNRLRTVAPSVQTQPVEQSK